MRRIRGTENSKHFLVRHADKLGAFGSVLGIVPERQAAFHLHRATKGVSGPSYERYQSFPVVFCIF